MKKIRNRKDLQITDLLIAHGPAGYGVYVMLTQYLSERKSLRRRQDISRIAYELHAPAEMVRSVLEDFGLFVCIDDEFANESAPKKPAQPMESEPSESSEKSELSERAETHNKTNSPSRKLTGKRIPVKKMLKRRKYMT